MRWVIAILYIIVALLAFACIPSYESAGVKVFENPKEVSNSIYYFLAIVMFTALILFLAKKSERILKAIMYFLVFIAAYYVFIPFFKSLSVLIAFLLVFALIKKPNVFVLNFSALVLAGGITSIFGISLEPFPVIVLLTALAVYDIISVYRTGHMIKLADSIIKLNLPMLFIIPSRDRPIVFGVGDAVIPNILFISAQTFSRSPSIGFIKLQALTTLIGSFIGLLVLIAIAERKKRPHAGLPFLNFGAISGYFLGYII